ncbi:MAG: glycosyltransferase, partial [Actinomycetota bacterium]|nr:glycosyltransferase [Actinomycetota bacterium]
MGASDSDKVGERLPTVSVVVPTYNRRENLPRVLEPLLADPATTELVVVVDGSRDGSFELVEERAATEPRLKPVFIENQGVARAHQTGVERASGEVVLLLADDVIAAPGLVMGHAR